MTPCLPQAAPASSDSAIFSSFEQAKSHLKSVTEENELDGTDKSCYFEIERIPVDQVRYKDDIEGWCFSPEGDLLRHWVPGEECPSMVSCVPISGRFAIGDLVTVEASPWNPYSCVNTDIIGVITDIDEEDNERQANPVSAPDKEGVVHRYAPGYQVDYIDSDGYLDHCHPNDAALGKFSGCLPRQDRFLLLYSSHIKSEKSISPTVLRQVYEQRMQVRDTANFWHTHDH